MKKIMTICFLLKKDSDGVQWVCLAEKKRGFRMGKLNGYGGKLEPGETPLDAAVRETQEESLVEVASADLIKVGKITYYDNGPIYECHIFLTFKWRSEPIETEEMNPSWYPVTNIPFDRMGKTDHMWIPQVLTNNYVEAAFNFDKTNKLSSYEIKVSEL